MGFLIRWSGLIFAIRYFSELSCKFSNAHPLASQTKDMYVVRATVYQVGIITNKTDGEMQKQQGHQEAITFYNRNGSDIDLSGIKNPLVTNVTAQSIVGLAPVGNTNQTRVIPWNALEKLASLQTTNTFEGRPTKSEMSKSKRDVSEAPVKIVTGTAVIPSGNGIQSLALPPLITLNNNLSHIPVPIPNTSIVRYAKINTLVKTN